jgi:hypothetical protein
MKKTFVCLANSKKYHQRCIAGVEIENFDGNSYSIIKADNQPKWIRPVSSIGHGEVSEKVVGKVRLLDVVEIEVLKKRSQGYQSENILFDEESLQIVGRLDWSPENVEVFQNTDIRLLFGNRWSAIRVDAIDQVDYSLVLIKPIGVTFREVTKPNGSGQLRSSFRFNGVMYDLPITDIDFYVKYQ